jgi:hypothetical protein
MLLRAPQATAVACYSFRHPASYTAVRILPALIERGNWTLVDLSLLRVAGSSAPLHQHNIMAAQLMKQRALGAVAGPRRQACPSALSVTRAAVRPAIAGRARKAMILHYLTYHVHRDLRLAGYSSLVP